jgi:hypothetical protein
MSEQELMLLQGGQVLSQVARPHRCGETIPVEGQANLQPAWGGPGSTPPAAA